MMGSYARFMTPQTALEDEIWARQSAPPLYDEAMRTSRPFEEAQREMLARAALQRGVVGGEPQPITAQMLSDALEGIPSVPPHNSAQAAALADEELIDLTTSDAQAAAGSDAEDVQITLNTGAKAQWRRKSRSSSCDEGSSGVQSDSTRPCHRSGTAGDTSAKIGNRQVQDAVQMQLIEAPKTRAQRANDVLSQGIESNAILNERTESRVHATTTLDGDDTFCDNLAFIDHEDAVNVAGPQDGASVAESDTSLLEGDGDISMLSLD